MSKLVFPRDGTSRCPFVPGQKKILVPVSRCPGTRAGANVPGQTPLSRPVPGQNDLKIFKKKDQISHFRTSFLCFRTSFPVLERPFLLCLVLSRWTGRDRLSKSLPGPSRGKVSKSRPGPFHVKILSLSRCPFVLGQGRIFCPFVPKSCAVPSRWKR